MTASDTSLSTRLRAREWFVRLEPAAVTLAAVALVWIVVFSVLVVRRHEGFRDVDFDMGIYDQAIWLLARGRQLITVRGLPVLGHHASFGLALFAPASWLGAGPNVWNTIQIIVLALGAAPVYLLARTRRLSPWAAAALGLAFLLHPALQFLGRELLHPETLAITPLLAAWLCAVKGSWRWFALWCLVAISMKEDVAIVILVLGLIVAWRGDKRVGLTTAACAFAWFVIAAMVVMPAINGGVTHAETLLSGAGGSPGGIANTLFHDPSNITNRVFSSGSGDFAWRILLPFGLAPLIAPIVLAMGLPQFLIGVLSDVPWTRMITFHYVALPLTAAAIGMVEGVAFLGRRLGRPARTIAPLMVLICAIYGTVAWGPSPISAEYDRGWWPPPTDSRLDAKRAAVDAVPDDAAVSSSYNLVPQLSHRAEIYSFPNPWVATNWGVPGSATRHPDRVEWIVVDRQVTGTEDSELLRSILEGGEFRVVLDREDVLVARRVRA